MVCTSKQRYTYRPASSILHTCTHVCVYVRLHAPTRARIAHHITSHHITSRTHARTTHARMQTVRQTEAHTGRHAPMHAAHDSTMARMYACMQRTHDSTTARQHNSTRDGTTARTQEQAHMHTHAVEHMRCTYQKSATAQPCIVVTPCVCLCTPWPSMQVPKRTHMHTIVCIFSTSLPKSTTSVARPTSNFASMYLLLTHHTRSIIIVYNSPQDSHHSRWPIIVRRCL